MLTEHSTRAPSPRKTEPFAALPHTACVSNLSDAAYRVLGAVLYFARQGSCDATDRQLGQRCGKSVPAIKRSLRELEAKKWIERLSGGGPSRLIRPCSPGDPTPSDVIPYRPRNEPDTPSDVIPNRLRSDPVTGSETIPNRLRSDPVTGSEVIRLPAQKRSPLKKGEEKKSEERREPPPVPGEGPAAPAGEGAEDERAALEQLIAAGGPVARMARVRLAELGPS